MSLRTEDNTAKHRDKIEQYIYNCSGSFDSSSCKSATGVCINTVHKYLKIFEDWGLVKKIQHGNQRIYIRMEVTAEVKYNIKTAKTMKSASWLQGFELFYYLAGTAYTL